ncbi:uncharacterized protein LOC119981959 [Tripterygium wilfordii]|uniref:uncharacterized protein LOC119981959 n=1 Tax=Tripterygium wilfordii TaxID=458696 RepID=UPI0018F8592D|nr:uncharacterized protein LOC119981959 [Tripterygium wilfordii]
MKAYDSKRFQSHGFVVQNLTGRCHVIRGSARISSSSSSWDEIDYWVVKIVTSIPEVIPLIGFPLVELLRGSVSMGDKRSISRARYEAAHVVQHRLETRELVARATMRIDDRPRTREFVARARSIATRQKVTNVNFKIVINRSCKNFYFVIVRIARYRERL